MRKLVGTFLTLAALSLVNATAAQAASIALVNTNSGWYDQTGLHDTINGGNYIAGRFAGVHYADFFVFDLSSIAPTVQSATLQLFAYTISSNGTYSNFDVSTPVPSLIANSSPGLPGILTHLDLQSGSSYGNIALTTGQSNTLINITLNAAAIAAINANSGGLFAIGGDYLGDGSFSDYTFGFSQYDVRNQLIVDVPDGGLTISLLGGALMALGVLRRKFNQ